MVATDVGACTDGDADDVQDAIDNCPLVATMLSVSEASTSMSVPSRTAARAAAAAEE